MAGTERTLLASLLILALGASGAAGQEGHGSEGEEGHHAALPEEPIPLQTGDFPSRPDLLIELGEDYLAPGALGDGFQIPTGATWRPALWVFGTYRSGLQSFETGSLPAGGTVTNGEWANRLDINAQLRLTGTERILASFRPFGLGTLGYEFGDDPDDEGWQSEFDESLVSLFFEGDFGELFPSLDDDDSAALDYGFSVGRQPISFQDGMLVADNLDAVGVTRNSLRPGGMSNLRITGLWAWDEVHRAGIEDPSAQLAGLFTRADLPFSTLALDAIYTFADDATGDALHAGLSAVQRIGAFHRIFNTAFRVNASIPAAGGGPAATRGAVLFSEISWTPHATHDLWYLNGFWALGTYTSAARQIGGPLGRAGILFEAAGIGRFGSALSPVASDVAGGAFGRQVLFDHGRRQVVLEAAGLKDTDGTERGAAAVGVRYQQALGRRFIVRMDGFAAARESGEGPLGGRIETLIKF